MLAYMLALCKKVYQSQLRPGMQAAQERHSSGPIGPGKNFPQRPVPQGSPETEGQIKRLIDESPKSGDRSGFAGRTGRGGDHTENPACQILNFLVNEGVNTCERSKAGSDVLRH